MVFKDVVLSERPREKAIRFGIDTLSDVELLAIVLRTGTKQLSVMELSHYLLKEVGGFKLLAQTSVEYLMSLKGIKQAKALDILACFEIAKRSAVKSSEQPIQIKSPHDVHQAYAPYIVHQKQEHFIVLYLDTKNKVIKHSLVFKGTLNTSIVHPREIFSEAVKLSSAAIICLHNHPSGDISPSDEDIDVTKNLIVAGEVMGIPLIDHIILGEFSYFSLRDKTSLFN